TAEPASSAQHRFIIVIPVADRPRHIRACLDSLHQLLQRYPYGDGDRISVLIADDSAEAVHVAANRALAAEFSQRGLTTVHFGPDEQWALLAALEVGLPRVCGTAKRENFGHKGQGVMRNIAYLKVAELIKNTPADKLLIWSLDSDQEFCVKVATPEGDREVYAIDYFHDLDAIFSHTDALVLTGKVVGDPPVSPAVMTGNFLADVLGFLQRMAASDPAAACGQHGDAGQAGGEATYHDMADLFGFKQAATAYRYRCTLAGAHSEADCCAHFAARLNSFFYGEHPTRISYYQPADLLRSVQPARTVYQGNYVFRPQALKYFAPFATLRLRMSGPTLGRIIQAEIGARFVSANLPMLHKRTLESGGQSEFRPGIATATEMIAPVIDISGEFERQFYGDVMLFSIERLAREHSIRHPVSAAQQVPLGCTDLVANTLDAVRAELLEKYNSRQRTIVDRLQVLDKLLHDPACWWNRAPEHAAAVAHFAAFTANIAHNFGPDSAGHLRINAAAGWARWRTDLLEAIIAYPADRAAWEAQLCAH
ncbi:MAG: hypothetical protein WBM25_05195, partial [Azonexus sp.]